MGGGKGSAGPAAEAHVGAVNDGGVHTWLDVATTVHQVRRALVLSAPLFYFLP